MLSYALSSASTYFHLPVDEDEDKEIKTYQRKYLTWRTDPSSSCRSSDTPSSISTYIPQETDTQTEAERNQTLEEVLASDDLYQVLGISKCTYLDRVALRRAYLLRSRACHPDKFPNNKENATLAFQKVAVAYDVLSKPSSKRLYDGRSPRSPYNAFAARPTGHAEETFRGAVISVFNDFLDGDLEVIRNFLKTTSDLNPSLGLGDEGINSVITALQSIRERALTCRTCVYVLHAELSRLIEVQHALRQLSYFDLFGRSRLSIQLTRITLSLPIALEKALEEQNKMYGHRNQDTAVTILPRQLSLLIRSIDVALEKVERVLHRK
ncbi:DnaJ-domain-containing protein [Dendrothele bispora CBS 962.96]|uniref:DnaJ-domain-containing protein n=1 Tax=Dendrothele bispora (strain CBS 962.96) TaxID=1314807 RepID=A0A4S8ML13_DENBC|nr:DnaJ-domain-containing protein [Dendrothele bispora CBS 962.96]